MKNWLIRKLGGVEKSMYDEVFERSENLLNERINLKSEIRRIQSNNSKLENQLADNEKTLVVLHDDYIRAKGNYEVAVRGHYYYEKYIELRDFRDDEAVVWVEPMSKLDSMKDDIIKFSFHTTGGFHYSWMATSFFETNEFDMDEARNYIENITRSLSESIRQKFVAQGMRTIAKVIQDKGYDSKIR